MSHSESSLATSRFAHDLPSNLSKEPSIPRIPGPWGCPTSWSHCTICHLVLTTWMWPFVDLIQVCQGAFRSIDLNGVSIEPDHISLDVACAEFDLESLPRAASLLQAISIEEL